MDKQLRVKNLILTAMAVLAMSCPIVGLAAVEADHAKVIKMDGTAEILKAGSHDWTAFSQDMILSEGDTVKTGDNSELILELTGGTKTAEVTVRANTEMAFDTFRHEAENQKDQTLLDVTVGGVLVHAEKLRGESKFEVKTPTSIAGIRGTTFEVQVSPSGTEI